MESELFYVIYWFYIWKIPSQNYVFAFSHYTDVLLHCQTLAFFNCGNATDRNSSKVWQRPVPCLIQTPHSLFSGKEHSSSSSSKFPFGQPSKQPTKWNTALGNKLEKIIRLFCYKPQNDFVQRLACCAVKSFTYSWLSLQFSWSFGRVVWRLTSCFQG